jgi:hypothetical protein
MFEKLVLKKWPREELCLNVTVSNSSIRNVMPYFKTCNTNARKQL